MASRRSQSRWALVLAVVVTANSACAAPVIFAANGLPQPAGSLGGSAARSVAAAQHCEQPSEGTAFTTTSPERTDLDSAAVRAAIGDPTMFTSSSIRIYRHDCLVGESANDPQTEAVPQELWSATKSVMSMIVGVAVTRGDISLDDTVGRFLPQADAAHGAITLRQLMTQTSGLAFAWANDVAAISGDSVAYALSLPFVHEPGSYFEYAQTTLEVIGAMVEAAVGRDLQDYAQAELFAPLGIARSRWHWERDGAGHTLGFAGLSMTSIDLARLGSMLLNGGRWRDRRVISSDYVTSMGQPGTANGGYGLLTWTNRGTDFYTASSLVRHHIEHRWIVSAPPDLFAMSGLFDQVVLIIPSLDMVVVRTGGPEFAAGWTHAFMKRLLDGLLDVHLPDPGPLPQDLAVDLTDFSKLIDFQTWPKAGQ